MKLDDFLQDWFMSLNYEKFEPDIAFINYVIINLY